MRVMWLSNNPAQIVSGYGTQSALILPRLAAMGHDLAIIPTQGVNGSKMSDWNGIPVYPAGNEAWSADVTGQWCRHFGADILISFVDAWVLDPERFLAEGCKRWVPYYPVDQEPIPVNVAEAVGKHAWASIAYSRFGQEMAQRVNIGSEYVPHGVETLELCPRGRHFDSWDTDRADMGLPPNAFVVGVVAANNDRLAGSRKNWHGIFDGFAKFKATYDGQTVLYLHTWLNGGIDLRVLIDQYGLRDCVKWCDPVGQRLGFDTDHMRDTYNAFDALLSPSLGEGCGLASLEAQSCGVPVITGDWTAQAEMCGSGIRIPKSAAAEYMTDFHSLQWIAGGAIIAQALHAMANRTADQIAAHAQMARAHALTYDIDHVAETYWKPVLNGFAARVAAEDAEGPLTPQIADHDAYQEWRRKNGMDE